jgi:FtsP/CotA-like multicopper oxidase with cupredoxin domain
MDTGHQDQTPRLTRRQSLKLGAASVIGTAALHSGNQAHAEDPPSGPTTTPWMMPLPLPQPKVASAFLTPTPSEYPAEGECGRQPHQAWYGVTPSKLYEIRVREALHSFHPQLPAQTIRGYDGTFPGPCIVARYNEPCLVRFYNEINPYAVGYGSPEISVHLHNLHCASESDGFAGDYWGPARYGPGLTRAGSFKDHLFMNKYPGFTQDPAGMGDRREANGTMWYHDHRMDFTEQNVYRGMAGLYLMFDAIDTGNEKDTHPEALRLPSGVGQYDVPLVFADFLFDQSGYTYYNPMAENKGHLGNKISVNGKIQPFMKVRRRKYRFRMLDCSVARFYEFFLMSGTAAQPFTYIANDGNLLEAPLQMTSVRIAPAERADIVIDFSKYPRGTRLYLVNRLVMKDGRGPEGLSRTGTQVLRFDVDLDPLEPDTSQVPARLREQPPINLQTVVKRRHFRFDKNNAIWAVNGKIFDVEKAVAEVKLNTAEIWTLEGNGSWFHPVHVHMEEGRLLTRNGVPPPVHERGRKDVFVLAPNEKVEVYFQFRDFTGKYLTHCHNLSHEDHAMMFRFDVVNRT